MSVGNDIEHFLVGITRTYVIYNGNAIIDNSATSNLGAESIERENTVGKMPCNNLQCRHEPIPFLIGRNHLAVWSRRHSAKVDHVGTIGKHFFNAFFDFAIINHAARRIE